MACVSAFDSNVLVGKWRGQLLVVVVSSFPFLFLSLELFSLSRLSLFAPPPSLLSFLSFFPLGQGEKDPKHVVGARGLAFPVNRVFLLRIPSRSECMNESAKPMYASRDPLGPVGPRYPRLGPSVR